MADKMTRIDKVNAIEAFIPETETDLLAFTAKLKEQFAKSKASGKPTAKQTENEGIKNILLTVLAEIGNPVTVGELIKVPAVAEAVNGSSQKATSLLRQLKLMGKVVRVVEGKTARYSLPTEGETEDTPDKE